MFPASSSFTSPSFPKIRLLADIINNILNHAKFVALEACSVVHPVTRSWEEGSSAQYIFKLPFRFENDPRIFCVVIFRQDLHHSSLVCLVGNSGHSQCAKSGSAINEIRRAINNGSTELYQNQGIDKVKTCLLANDFTARQVKQMIRKAKIVKTGERQKTHSVPKRPFAQCC